MAIQKARRALRADLCGCYMGVSPSHMVVVHKTYYRPSAGPPSRWLPVSPVEVLNEPVELMSSEYERILS